VNPSFAARRIEHVLAGKAASRTSSADWSGSYSDGLRLRAHGDRLPGVVGGRRDGRQRVRGESPSLLVGAAVVLLGLAVGLPDL